LAREKASSPSVKAFGAMMVADHCAANDKLKTVDAGKKIQSIAANAGVSAD
jgi:predicted outer membrane protein